VFCGTSLAPLAQAQAYTYQIDIVGGSLALQGTLLPITLYNQTLTGAPAPDDRAELQFTDAVSGKPLPYGGIDYVCPQPPGINNSQCTGTYPNYALGGGTPGVLDGYLTGAAPMWMNLVISPTATPGIHKIAITGSDFNGVTATTTWTINVVTAAQLALPQVPLAPAVPVPAKARWENDMTYWAPKWCPNVTPQDFNTYLFESIMFYDGARVYYQIGDYTGNPAWASCAHTLAVDYYPYISSGKFFGFSMFPRGLMLDTRRTGDSTSDSGVAILAQTSSWSYGNPEYMTDFTSLREDAFGLEALLDDTVLNGTAHPLVAQAASALIGTLDQIFIQQRFTWYQPFMVGLAMESLIQYNDQYPDPRVPYIIKQTLDAMWNAAWRPDLHGFYYRCYSLNLPGLPGLPADLPASNNGCFSPVSASDFADADTSAWPWTPGDVFNYNDVQPNLNNLISPAYAWMYLQTGDTKYREEADDLFAGGVIYNGAINYAGKEFSQNYRWSFDGVKWRDQANSQGASPITDNQPPVVSMAAPASGKAVGVTMAVVADASDNIYVTGVQFQIDGVNLGPPVTSLPFELVNVPTFLIPNGTHNITAIAYDAAGNSTVSAPISITVNNPANASFEECPVTGIPTGMFQGCYYQVYDNFDGVFNHNASTPPPSPTMGTLVTTSTDPAIDFDWAGDPAPGVNVYHSTEVWQGWQMFQPGSYTFSTLVDGQTGIRVYVDGQLVDNQWLASGADDITTNNYYCPQSFTLNFLQSGLRLIRVETWHNYQVGLDSVHVSWVRTGPVAPIVVNSTLTVSPASIDAGQPVTLAWSSTNASHTDPALPNTIDNSTGCFGTNFNTGTNQELSGTTVVRPQTTTTYSVTCYGPAGSSTAKATVAVFRTPRK
jgi:hypothetical protein